jgi:uncharacterized protein (TIGR02266 family)
MERERRAHARKSISTGVAFRESGGVLLRGWLHDVSRGGCFIATPSHLTFGEPLEFQFRLPGVYAQITGSGTVAWVREKSERDMPAGMGIRFVEVDESLLAAIDGVSTTGARLSRPSTIIGIAPAPKPSAPSFSPPDENPQADAPKGEAPVPAPAKRRSQLALVIGAVVVASSVAIAAVFVGRRHRPAQVSVDAAGEGSTVADAAIVEAALDATIADASAIMPAIVDASADAADARARDGGRDGGRSKPKPKHH